MPQLGGKHAYWGCLGKDRSLGEAVIPRRAKIAFTVRCRSSDARECSTLSASTPRLRRAQLRKIVADANCVWMVGPERIFVNRQRALVERPRGGEVVLDLE